VTDLEVEAIALLAQNAGPLGRLNLAEAMQAVRAVTAPLIDPDAIKTAAANLGKAKAARAVELEKQRNRYRPKPAEAASA
jgi:hypothetical protein